MRAVKFRYREFVSSFLFILMMSALCFSMGQGGRHLESRSTASKEDQWQLQSISISEILRDPVSFSGRQMKFQGRFLGWSSCPQSDIITRSDWVLDDGTGCIYVTGRLPTGLALDRPAGEQITVTGTVEMNNNRPVVRATAIIRNGRP